MSNLFRQKSLERISSPEQLNSYIRVSTPSVWLVLIAVVILLVGVCVWGVFGHMDTTLDAVAVSSGGTVIAYLHEDEVEKVSADMPVTIDGKGGRIVSVSERPILVDDTFDAYALYVGELEKGEWVYELTLDIECEDGVYTARITTGSVAPMSFVLN